MGLFRHPYTSEERTASGKLASFLGNRGWVEVVPAEVIEAEAEAVAEELKGKALEEALRANELPRTGNVAEKRERLAEHLKTASQFGYVDTEAPATGGEVAEPAADGPTMVGEPGPETVNPTDPIQDPTTTVAPEEQS